MGEVGEDEIYQQVSVAMWNCGPVLTGNSHLGLVKYCPVTNVYICLCDSIDTWSKSRCVALVPAHTDPPDGMRERVTVDVLPYPRYA
eukprot:COSAG01_NODE_2127_length_8365_cov_5.420276_9_plen_87_part_00